MIVTAGNKVHVATRRSFEGDLRRHLAGVSVTLTVTEFGTRW
jgi:hypothetical protein